MATAKADDFTARMFDAINGMMRDVLAAVARKDYEDRRRRQAEGQAKAKAAIDRLPCCFTLGSPSFGHSPLAQRRKLTRLENSGPTAISLVSFGQMIRFDDMRFPALPAGSPHRSRTE
jgi:hypothetical protein